MSDIDAVLDLVGAEDECDQVVDALTRFTDDPNAVLLAARSILRRRLIGKFSAPAQWNVSGDYGENQAPWQADGIRRRLAAIGEAIGDGEDAVDPLPTLTQTPICGPTLRR